MNDIKTGGPAFPTAEIFLDEVVYTGGMNMRDYFAAKAMNGLIGDPQCQIAPEELVQLAYEYADAMIKAREAK